MPPTVRPARYHVSGLALAVGIDQAQVSRWKAAGMPFKADGKIDLPTAVRWIREHERRDRPQMSVTDAAQRKLAAEAELAELKVARERGDVVLASDVRAAAEDEAARVAGVLSQLPSEFAPLLAARLGVTVRAASAVLREVSDGVRSRLAGQDVESNEEAA